MADSLLDWKGFVTTPFNILGRCGLGHKMLVLVSFTNSISIPGRYLHDEIPGSIRHGLTGKPAFQGETWCIGQLIILRVAHIRQRRVTLADDAVTGRTGANSPARVVDIHTVCERNVEDAPRQTCVVVWNFLRIYLHADIHRQESDRELLFRGRRRLMRDVRIGTAHEFNYRRRCEPLPRTDRSFPRSACLSRMNSPTGRVPSEYRPILMRTNLSTGQPMASHIRRT